MKKLLCVLLLGVLVSACHTTRRSGQDDGIIEVVFLQMNDVYEIAPMSDGRGGLARVATLRQQLLAKNPNTITILAGDFISPSYVGALRYEGKRIRGRQMIDVLNTLGLDYVVFGNHEFDYDDPADLQARIDESRFTWFAANALYRHPTGGVARPFAKNLPDGSSQPCPSSKILELRDADGTALRLGMFGVLLDSGQKPYVEYGDWFEVGKKTNQQLRSSGAEVVVALTHLLVADDIKLAAMLPDVPLLMGGHDHENQIHRNGKNVVAKADANARTVYIHTLRHNKKTNKTTVTSELKNIDGNIADDPATAATVKKWDEIVAKSLISSGFDPARTVTTLRSDLDCRETAVRYSQCPAGEIVATSLFVAARNKPDCAVVNGGSIRIDDVLRGTVSEVDVLRMLPFEGGMAEVEMSGTTLRRMLDGGRANRGVGGYLHMVRIAYDDARGLWLVNNLPIDDNQKYRVALPNFLLGGTEPNLGFLKTEAANPDGTGSTNPDIAVLYRPKNNDTSDVRNDVRRAVIQYWRTQK
jgi:2',3'-cyclic-nucleotide 2'-phosphodiesterase (5'-nucleotidase family)